MRNLKAREKNRLRLLRTGRQERKAPAGGGAAAWLPWEGAGLSRGTPLVPRAGAERAKPCCGKSRDGSEVPLATTDLYLNRIKYALCEGNTPLLSQTWGHPLSPKSCHSGLCGALCSEPEPSLSGQAPNTILFWLFLFLFFWRPGPYLCQGGSQTWRVPPCLSHAQHLG